MGHQHAVQCHRIKEWGQRFGGWALAAAIGLFSALPSTAEASLITLVCENPMRQYSILFDDRTGVLIWKSAFAEVQYQLRRVHFDNNQIMVWGRTRDYGHDYLMKIADQSWIKYFYGNGSEETDPCSIISRKN